MPTRQEFPWMPNASALTLARIETRLTRDAGEGTITRRGSSS
jgi:hypothetical protein